MIDEGIGVLQRDSAIIHNLYIRINKCIATQVAYNR